MTEDFDLTGSSLLEPKSFVVIATQRKGFRYWLERALQGNAAYVAGASHHRAGLVSTICVGRRLKKNLATVYAPAGCTVRQPRRSRVGVVSQMVALRRGGISSLPMHDDRLSGRDFGTDIVIPSVQ